MYVVEEFRRLRTINKRRETHEANALIPLTQRSVKVESPLLHSAAHSGRRGGQL